jgi:putative NIF3 family GTP cyclohydrolase 1 type 2
MQEQQGHGRIGNLASSVSLGELAKHIARVIPPTASGVRVAGNFDSQVDSVALCGGAGDSFVDLAYEAGADVYVTSDLRHHPVQEALELAKAEGRDFALIDISHWAAEWLWLEWAAADIHGRFASIQVVVSEIRTDPWDFSVTQ